VDALRVLREQELGVPVAGLLERADVPFAGVIFFFFSLVLSTESGSLRSADRAARPLVDVRAKMDPAPAADLGPNFWPPSSLYWTLAKSRRSTSLAPPF